MPAWDGRFTFAASLEEQIMCIPAAARDLSHNVHCPVQYVHAHKKRWPLNTQQDVSPILYTLPVLEVLKDDLMCCACRGVAVC